MNRKILVLAVLLLVFSVLPVSAVDPTVTFGANIGDNAVGTILTVDNANYTIADLPVTFNWENATTHSFHFYSPISAGTGEQYLWNHTSGLSTLRSGNITVTEDGQVWAYYTWSEAPITPGEWVHALFFGYLRWIFILVLFVLGLLLSRQPFAAFLGIFVYFFVTIQYLASYSAPEDGVCAALLVGMAVYLMIQFVKKAKR